MLPRLSVAEPEGLSTLVESSALRKSMAVVEPSMIEHVRVRVRVIKATEPIAEEGVVGEDGAQVVEPQIQDLASKLEKIDFKQFRMITAVREQIGLKRKTTLSLSDGQALIVRPLYVEDRRTGLWLKWLDRGGAEILDTRMHFECGESLLAGTNHRADAGLILAIDVSPVK